jgi:hypothetical protein
VRSGHTHAALGTDIARLRRIDLRLAPQPQDLGVDRAVVYVIVVQARHVQKLIARQNAIGRPEQHDKQTELAIAESNDLPGRRHRSTARIRASSSRELNVLVR